MNNLTSASTTSALSAAQGKILNEKMQSGMVWERVRTNYTGYDVFPTSLDYRNVIALAVSASATLTLNRTVSDSDYCSFGFSKYEGEFACSTCCYLSNSSQSGTVSPYLLILSRSNGMEPSMGLSSSTDVYFGANSNNPYGYSISTFTNISLLRRYEDISVSYITVSNFKCNSWVLRSSDLLSAFS